MWLVIAAMRRPVTILVAVLAMALCASLAVRRMAVDIFPDLGAPVIYVAQPYGGMDPAQMEGYLTYYYEYHFLYISGIEHVESKNIQGAALMKLVFHPGTDMSQAMAQVVGYVNRSRAFMPPGAVPPFIMRFDTGSVQVGQLVFSSPNRTPGDLQNIALNQVRPLFATLPGVSAPPPFGGNQKTIVVRLNPERMRAYRISPEEAIAAVNRASTVMPSGNVRTGELNRIVSSNAAISADLNELLEAPVRPGAYPAVFLRDIAEVENATDIVTAYAHVNGKRTVYIQVTKRSDASTLDVIRRVREGLPAMRRAAPEDVDIQLEFDQSIFVVNAIRGLVNEGLTGAVLTGLMVLVFLRDWRSALIVITTIPLALLSAVVCLWTAGQTINIMTLGGLALAVGVLVDEATVEIENIHTHLASGANRARAVLQACSRTAVPRLLSMLSVLAVFIPSFFMAGVARQMFVPLSLAVGFAMIASYALSSTFVPVLSTWMMRRGHSGGRSRLGRWYESYLSLVLRMRWPVVAVYTVSALVVIAFAWPRLGTEIFPQVDYGQFQLRLRAPTGTRIERTELVALGALKAIEDEVGRGNVRISSGFIGVQPASYPINTVYLWTSGPHEAVLLVGLKPEARLRGEALRERLRLRLRQAMPDVAVSFEAGDIVNQVMSFGSPTPIEVAVQGANLAANRAHAQKVRRELEKLPYLRDIQYAQPLDYPTLDVTVDRERAGQFGLTASNIARSLVAATSSSRFVEPNYWRDPASGNAFQIQVEIPQQQMTSMEDVREIPLAMDGSPRPLLGDVASLQYGSAPGQIERYNMQRVVSITANLEGRRLGDIAPDLRAAIDRAGAAPRGVTVSLRGQIPPLVQMIDGLSTGLLLSIVSILLLLIAYFQSVRLAMVVLSAAPAVLCGVMLALLATGTSLNLQSFMGAIMALGISVANAILLVSFSEAGRQQGLTGLAAALEGAAGRLRAILMTALAMIAGMVPLALGTGDGGAQAAPLGRAVIGGLAVATLATLTVLPSVYAILMGRLPARSRSLDPDDPKSPYHDAS